MTDEFEDWEPQERIPWEPKTPREEREPLANAPLAILRATPATPQAFTLMGDLAKRYPRPQAAKGKAYARHKTLVDYANAVVRSSPICSSLLRATGARAGLGAHTTSPTTPANTSHGLCLTVFGWPGLRRA
jgi:hypothetical protein